MYHEGNDTNRQELVHDIRINNEVLENITGSSLTVKKKTVHFIPVNSIHHQAVKDIPANALSVAEYSPNYNDPYHELNAVTNEALIYVDRKIASVQYHPEEIDDILAQHLIFNYLLA